MINHDIPFVNLKLINKRYKKKFIKILKSSIDQSNFIKDKHNYKLEKEIRKKFNCKKSILVNSGTDALIIGIKSLNLKKNDEIITTSNTWVSSAYAIELNNCKPVFIDVSEIDFQMNCNLLQKKLTKKTKAIIVTHLYGQPNQMDKIIKFSKKNNLYIIEDIAQSHLAKFKNKIVGNFGHLSCLSFYPSKNLGALGDGGAIITNNKIIYEKYLKLSNYGSKNFKDPDHKMVGFNSRMDEIQAAFLNEKIKNLNKDTNERIKLAKIYNSYCKLLSIKNISSPKNTKNVYHIYPVILNNRDKVQKELKKYKINCQVHYKIPIHLQKAFKHLKYKKGDLPVTERLSKSLLSLPFYPGISKNKIHYIFEKLKKILNH